MYLVIAPDGEVKRYENLENEEITGFVQQDFVVIEVKSSGGGYLLNAVVFDEDAQTSEVKEA